FKSAEVQGKQYVGIAVGQSAGGSISNVHTSGTVTGELHVGGIAGALIVGNTAGSVLERSSASAEVKATGDYAYGGGIVGSNDSSQISNVVFSGNVAGTFSAGTTAQSLGTD